MRKLALVGAVLCLGLVGCGSATVDSDSGIDTSVAPLSREKTSDVSTTRSSESVSGGASSEQEPSESRNGGKDVAEPKQEAAYLDSLKNAGVKVDGVEDQLLGAGQAACGEDEITIPAVAGQLIEQQRSDMDFEELTKLLQDNARSALC